MSDSALKKTDKPRRTFRWTSPRTIFSALAVIASVIVAFTINSMLRLPAAWSFLIGVNVVTLGLYGYDKAVAKLGWLRVPEFVLHVVTVAGGTPAAFLGQNLFNHKTAKSSFRRKFWLIVVAQFVVFGAWIYWSHSRSAG